MSWPKIFWDTFGNVMSQDIFGYFWQYHGLGYFWDTFGNIMAQDILGYFWQYHGLGYFGILLAISWPKIFLDQYGSGL